MPQSIMERMTQAIWEEGAVPKILPVVVPRKAKRGRPKGGAQLVRVEVFIELALRERLDDILERTGKTYNEIVRDALFRIPIHAGPETGPFVKRLTLYLPPEYMERLGQVSAQVHRPVPGLLRCTLRRFLDQEWPAAGPKQK